jgi:hypothetical protein
VFTAAERPDLWLAVQSDSRFSSLWPEYNHHGNHSRSYFDAPFPQHADLQVLVLDDQVDEVVARGRTIPFRWDGTLEDLPKGIDAVGLRAVKEAALPTSLSALAAEVLTEISRAGSQWGGHRIDGRRGPPEGSATARGTGPTESQGSIPTDPD